MNELVDARLQYFNQIINQLQLLLTVTVREAKKGVSVFRRPIELANNSSNCNLQRGRLRFFLKDKRLKHWPSRLINERCLRYGHDDGTVKSDSAA